MKGKIPYSEWEKIRNSIREKYDKDWNEYIDILIEEQKMKKRKFAFGYNDELIEVKDG